MAERAITASEQDDYLIVGAGVCGLTAAWLLAKEGRRVTVLEREATVGGLARSFRYPDGAFDCGPHRFHTANDRIRALIEDVLGEDALTIARLSMVHFRGRYYRWPIHPSVQLLHFPLPIMIGIGFDLLFRLYRKHPPKTFSDYVLNMYGKTLYRAFFRDYSEKFLGIPPEDTDADWAKTGIDRAIIDERLQIHTLWELIRSVLVKPNQVETKFLYGRGGTGTYSEKLAERIRAAGGRIETGAPVEAVSAEDGALTAVRAGGREYRARRVIWTAPLTVLAGLLNEPTTGEPALRYLDIVFYNLVTKTRSGPAFQWCYFGEKPIPFNRVSRPEDFDPNIIPGGRYGLCVEVSAPPGHPAWTDPAAQLPGIYRGLVDVGLLRDESDVAATHIERVTECYPIYTAGYRAPLKALKERLGRYRNVILAGRTGMYWYNNMDHSIGLAMKIAKDELAGRRAPDAEPPTP